MSESFVGRPVLPGAVEGRALVTRVPFDALASFKSGLQGVRQAAFACDPANPDILGVRLTGTILCLPQAVGSTSAGTTWDLIACRRLEPAAMLFAEPIDSLSAGGLVVAAVWDLSPIVVVDRLGPEFLDRVSSGARVAVFPDGSVTLS